MTLLFICKDVCSLEFCTKIVQLMVRNPISCCFYIHIVLLPNVFGTVQEVRAKICWYIGSRQINYKKKACSISIVTVKSDLASFNT